MVLIVKRLRSPSTPPQLLAKLLSAAAEESNQEVDSNVFVEKLVEEQLGKIWREVVVDGRLRVEERAVAGCLVKNISALGEVDDGVYRRFVSEGVFS
jgi:hypothetical protein